MTHTDNLAWAALILAILAVVFHIPLTMLAHHYLPKVEDYIASRSKERLTRRIIKLQGRLIQLDNPSYIEDVEWSLREHLFVIMYLFGTGFTTLAASLFLSMGVVLKSSWFWNPAFTHMPLADRLPELTVVFFLSGVALAGQNMHKSTTLRPSRRPKLRREIQTQIDKLKGKLATFGP